MGREGRASNIAPADDDPSMDADEEEDDDEEDRDEEEPDEVTDPGYAAALHLLARYSLDETDALPFYAFSGR